MLKANQHIVDKVFVEIGTSSEEEAVRIKNNVSTFLCEKLFPELELTLNKLGAEGQIYRFDKVDLSISVDSWNNAFELNSQIKKQLIEKINVVAPGFEFGNRIANQASVKIVNGEQTEVSSTENLQNIFFYFLEHAHLPWYGRKEQIQEFISSKKWDDTFLTSLGKLLSENEAALDRLVLQFSTMHVLNFISAFGNVKFQPEKDGHKKIEKLRERIRNQLLKLLIHISVFDNTKDKLKEYKELVIARISEGTFQNHSAERILDEHENWIKQFIAKKTFEKYFVFAKDRRDAVLKLIGQQLQTYPQKRGFTQNKRSDVENKLTVISHGNVLKTEKEPLFFDTDFNGMAVQNAGQVLFYPFIPALFKHFKWFDQEDKINSEFLQVAIQTLHYCATGKEYFFEGDLILEKYMCGLPLSLAVPAESRLTQEIKNEVDAMLKQLIGYCPELKNTSPDGLRELFIKRDGKLIQKDNGYKLIVERKAQDVLLENLQWNISVVKMPWSKSMLFVEW